MRASDGLCGGLQEEGQCLNVLVGHSCAVNSVAVDRHGKIAVTAGADGTGRVWDLATGSCVQLLLGHTSLGDPTTCTHSLARCISGISLRRRMTVLGCTRTAVVSPWELLP